MKNESFKPNNYKIWKFSYHTHADTVLKTLCALNDGIMKKSQDLTKTYLNSRKYLTFC